MNINTKYHVRNSYIQFDPEPKNTVFQKLSSYLKPKADVLLPKQPAVKVKVEDRTCDEPLQVRQVILLCFKLWRYLNNKTLADQFV